MSLDLRRQPSKFKPLERSEELAILQTDNSTFSKTRKYLKLYIEDALDHFEWLEDEAQELQTQLLSDVPLAARRFLRNPDKKTRLYKFSTYFGWYIARRINKRDPKRKPGR